MHIIFTKQDVEQYLRLSFYILQADFERYAREVLLFDLKPLMCEEFFEDLTTNPQNYPLLLEGGMYDYNGSRYHFEGLRGALSYFFYSRYILTSHQQDTKFGIKEKNYQDGTPLSATERRDTSLMYKQNASTLWEACQKYIERNSALFPLWNACRKPCTGEKNQPKSNRLTWI